MYEDVLIYQIWVKPQGLPEQNKQITSPIHTQSKWGFHSVKKHVFKTWVLFSDKNPCFLETWVFVGNPR